MSIAAIKLAHKSGVSYPRVLSFKRQELITLPDDANEISEPLRRLNVERIKAIDELRDLGFSIVETRSILSAFDRPEATLDELQVDQSLEEKIRANKEKLEEIESRVISGTVRLSD